MPSYSQSLHRDATHSLGVRLRARSSHVLRLQVTDVMTEVLVATLQWARTLSVLTRSGGWPSSTNVVATASTSGVGPHTMHSGCFSGENATSASMSRSIRLA